MNWKDTPKNQKIICIALVLVIFLYLGRLFSGAIIKGMRESELELIQMQAERENLALAEEELDGGKTEAALKAELEALEALMPKVIDAQFLLKQFTSRAAQRGIEIVLLEPQVIRQGETKEGPDGSPIQGPSTLPIRVKMNASFGDMVRYINDIESHNSLLSTSALSARANTEGLGKLRIDTTFEIMLAPGGEKVRTGDEEHPVDPKPKSEEVVLHPEVQVSPLQIRELSFVSLDAKNQRSGKPQKKDERQPPVQSQAPPAQGTPSLTVPFTVDGILGTRVLVKGEIFKTGDQIEGWTLTAIDHKRGEIRMEQNGFQSVLSVMP